MINKKYTKYGYRINQVSEGQVYNWLFLPGGPGLGSEYLTEFCEKLTLPGNIFRIDFPKDGTNLNGELDLNYWQAGLIDLIKLYPNTILVTHSFSGMFALMLPEMEAHLVGLVMMNTTTSNNIVAHVDAMRQQHGLPDLVPVASEYHLNPSNETYKSFWETYKNYCFTPDELPEGEKILSLFAYNNAAYYFAIEHIFLHYKSKWHPSVIPAMTIASELDFICPPHIFMRDKAYQVTNVLNKIIDQAGHCPWVKHFAQVQQCFDEFLQQLR